MSGKEFLAAIDASLNAASGILLVVGYVLILRKNYRGHATAMIAALATSTAFLCFYLYSQFTYGDRTIGLKPGPLRTFYLVLLASHVLLAIGMVPPIIVTTWRAYQRNWIAHTKISRPTFWIWIYVSVTGVIVYWLLYHVFPK